MKRLSVAKSKLTPARRSTFAVRSLVIALAVGIDLLWGEPPTPVHPVVWMGRLIGREQRALPRRGRLWQLVAGASVVAANVALAGTIGGVVERLTGRLPLPARLLTQGALLSSLMSLRMLGSEAARVTRHVERDDLDGARHALLSLVSRDVSQLDAPLLLAAAIESVAENASDSVVAPLLAYAVGGLPGAAIYRMANTMDAMIGYRGDYEYLGKAAARFDDLLNWLPARMTAALLTLAAPLIGGDSRRAWAVAKRDHRLAASPNAGWPMSAAAGALPARLEKQGHYALGAELPLPDALTVSRAVRLLHSGVALFVATLILGSLLRRTASSLLRRT